MYSDVSSSRWDERGEEESVWERMASMSAAIVKGGGGGVGR
jgi:hypothetical protein